MKKCTESKDGCGKCDNSRRLELLSRHPSRESFLWNNLHQERLLLVLAPITGDVGKKDETAVYLAHIRAAADDGGVVQYANKKVVGITRCVREIIPQHSRVQGTKRAYAGDKI